MKIQLSFETFRDFCIAIAEEIKSDFAKDVVIVPVMRGGMLASQIISKHLMVPCGAIWVDNNDWIKNCKNFDSNYFLPKNSNNIVFVDDITALGRTKRKIDSMMKFYGEEINWKYASVVVDHKCTEFFDYIGFQTKHWIVMPYEDINRVVEGNQGLFRDNKELYLP